VCADGWDEIATNIVCNQLGYSAGNHSGLSYSSSATYYFVTLSQRYCTWELSTSFQQHCL
jgi:hypothetical protein